MHLANNLFKGVLVGRHADVGVVVRFVVPAAVAALAGAALLSLFAMLPPIVSYHLGETVHDVTAVKAVIGVLIVGLSLAELLPGTGRLVFERRHLIIGGLLSGFFGGLSGNQEALRSAFLLKCGLSKEAFIGTGVAAAVAAFLGAFIGTRVLKLVPSSARVC